MTKRFFRLSVADTAPRTSTCTVAVYGAKVVGAFNSPRFHKVEGRMKSEKGMGYVRLGDPGSTPLRAAVVFAIFIGIVCSATFVQADLARVGPIDAANGFPLWYQDHSGLALDLCIPNATELQNGACLILPANVPDPAQPISFPGNFPQEAFWWNATTTMNVNGGKALMMVALEAAFLNGPVIPGDQMAFARVRLRIDTPNAGSFRVIYPFGEKTFDVASGGHHAIDFTADVGLVPGNFALALGGPIGPFLMASASPGGDPLPFVVIPGGNTYLADATLLTAITGSPFNTNYFRIEGPNIGGSGIDFAEIDQFTLLGKVHPGPIASTLTVDRATYIRDNSGAWVDVFANAAPAIGAPPPILSFSGAGIPGRIMDGDGQHFHGQSIPVDPNVLPPTVFVTNDSDNPPSTTEIPLTDVVTINQASFNGDTLTVAATSSDSLIPPTLAVLEHGPMTSGVLVETGIVAPPSQVTVVSSSGGSSSMLVTTVQEPVAGPVVVDDTATTNADQPVVVDVLANDPGPAAVLQVLGNPAHGAVSLIPCPAPSTSLSCIQYTPKLYYFGADQFTYVVQDGSNVDSNVGTVAITVNFVNHNPVANNDSASVGKNTFVVIDVLANDVDPDGNATLDPASVTIIDAPAVGFAAVDTATGRITYTASDVEGAFTFTYAVSDTSIPVLVSNVATVTANVFQPDAISVIKAIFVTSKKQWTISGTTVVPGPSNIVTVHVGPILGGTVIGTTSADVTGAWKLVVKNSSVLPDGSKTISLESSQGAQLLGVSVKVK